MYFASMVRDPAPPPGVIFFRHNLKSEQPSDTRPLFFNERLLTGPVRHAHLHDGVEIGTVARGRGAMFYGNRVHRFGPGDVYYLNGMHMHGHGAWPGTKCLIVYAHIKLESIILLPPPRGDFRLFEPFAAGPRGGPPILRRARGLCRKILAAARSYRSPRAYGDLRAWNTALSILIDLAEKTVPQMAAAIPPGEQRRRAYLSAALSFIHTRFLENFSVEEVARACGLSASHLSHLFKAVLHESPVDYRNKLRVAHALEKLRATDDKITAIALESGFQSLSQFHALFRRFMGRSPAAFRKKQDRA
jgi:AraC-like DNA-binding protein